MEKKEYKLGDIVFLLTDPEQYERIITGILHRPDGIKYYISHSTEETIHYDIEISK